jgi:Predicted signal transduction protein with a C-terminal ATPase domain
MNLLKKPFNHYFHNTLLKRKFILSHLIVMLIPSIAISMLFYSQFSEILLVNSIDSEQKLLKQTGVNIENTIDQIYNVSDNISRNETFQKMMSLSDEELSDGLFLKDKKFETEMKSFLSDTASLINGNIISSIKIYVNPSFDPIYSDHTFSFYKILQPDTAIKGSYWYGIFQSTDKSVIICPSLYLTPTESSKYGELSIVRKIPFSNDGEINYAYVVVYFTKSSIDSILTRDLSIANSAIYLVNQRDSLISSTNSSIAGKYIIPFSNIKRFIPDISKFSTISYPSEKVYMGYRVISGTDWDIISVIPRNSILSSTKYLLIRFFITYLFFAIISAIFALLLSSSIVRRISSVINQMKHIRYGELLKLNMSAGHDEIGDLVDTYNYMIDEMNNLLVSQANASNALRISELRALQAQINPHFLYNTLDMINWLSKEGKSDVVGEAVHALSRFYKLTLSKGNTIGTLEAEIEHVSLYVQLQNMRYQNKIHFLVDIPDELLEYEIPKLIFQPIVENSIQHGILGKESKEGTIVITGWSEGDSLVLLLSDDGIGMEEEKVKIILTGTGESKIGSNIGVMNTHRRLQLFYGDSFGLTYRSTPNVGTEVEIRIPARIFVPTQK